MRFSAVAEADRRGGLALAGRRRADGGDQDQLAVRPRCSERDELGGDLRLVVAVGLEVLRRDAEPAPISRIGRFFAARAISMSLFTFEAMHRFPPPRAPLFEPDRATCSALRQSSPVHYGIEPGRH